MSAEVRIELVRGEHGWVATDEDTGISSQPMETREGALDDLDENLALASGELRLSDEILEDLDESRKQREAGETVPADEVYRELGIGE